MCTRKRGCGRQHTQDTDEGQILKQERAMGCFWRSGCKCSKYEERQANWKPKEERATTNWTALGEVDVNAPSMKSGKPTGSQRKKEQPPTGTILAYAEHDKLLRFTAMPSRCEHSLLANDVPRAATAVIEAEMGEFVSNSRGIESQ